MAEKKSMMSLSSCCDEVVTRWLVLAVGALEEVGSGGLLEDVEEAKS
jgi:hypothetical protein